MSRVDTLVDKLLGDKIAAGGDVSRYEGLLGQAAIANARLAYARFKEIFAGPEWQSLAEVTLVLRRLIEEQEAVDKRIEELRTKKSSPSPDSPR